jgi:hypothetical protein
MYKTIVYSDDWKAYVKISGLKEYHEDLSDAERSVRSIFKKARRANLSFDTRIVSRFRVPRERLTIEIVEMPE